MTTNSDSLIGKAKQVAGVATDDKKLEGEGKAQQAKGDLKDKVTDALNDVGNKVDELKKKVNEK